MPSAVCRVGRVKPRKFKKGAPNAQAVQKRAPKAQAAQKRAPKAQAVQKRAPKAQAVEKRVPKRKAEVEHENEATPLIKCPQCQESMTASNLGRHIRRRHGGDKVVKVGRPRQCSVP